MSERYPDDLLYSRDHEWLRRLEGDRCRIGITWFAQDELGEVVFVDQPEVGSSFEEGEEIGTIESVKAVAEIYTPVAGEIVTVNEALEETPEKVNEDPYGEGWLVELRWSDEKGLDDLMAPGEYARFIEAEAD